MMFKVTKYIKALTDGKSFMGKLGQRWQGGASYIRAMDNFAF